MGRINSQMSNIIPFSDFNTLPMPGNALILRALYTPLGQATGQLYAWSDVDNTYINIAQPDFEVIGTWDANTDTPSHLTTLTQNGKALVVKTAGNTVVNGFTNWMVGDYLVLDNGIYFKQPKGFSLLSGLEENKIPVLRNGVLTSTNTIIDTSNNLNVNGEIQVGNQSQDGSWKVNLNNTNKNLDLQRKEDGSFNLSTSIGSSVTTDRVILEDSSGRLFFRKPNDDLITLIKPSAGTDGAVVGSGLGRVTMFTNDELLKIKPSGNEFWAQSGSTDETFISKTQVIIRNIVPSNVIIKGLRITAQNVTAGTKLRINIKNISGELLFQNVTEFSFNNGLGYSVVNGLNEYLYQEPIAIRSGTSIVITYDFSNATEVKGSEINIGNPSDPQFYFNGEELVQLLSEENITTDLNVVGYINSKTGDNRIVSKSLKNNIFTTNTSYTINSSNNSDGRHNNATVLFTNNGNVTLTISNNTFAIGDKLTVLHFNDSGVSASVLINFSETGIRIDGENDTSIDMDSAITIQKTEASRWMIIAEHNIAPDNFVDSVSFTNNQITLGRTGTLSDLTASMPIATPSNNGAMSGTQARNIQNLKIAQVEIGEPTGFLNRTDSTISVTGNVFTLGTTTQFSYYILGEKFTVNTNKTLTISNVEGNHYIYIDNEQNLQEVTTFNVETLLKNNAYVSAIYWDATNNKAIYIGDERHGPTMDWSTHEYLHTTFGSKFINGLGLSSFTIGNGSLDSHCQFGYGSGLIRDEDLPHVISSQSSPAQIPIYYKSGATPVIRRKDANNFPLIDKNDVTTTTRPKFNLNTSGTWSLSEVTNNGIWLIHYFATNDINHPIIGFLGTTVYTNATQARAGAEIEINSLSGLPFAEFTPIGTVIFQTDSFTNTSNAAIIEYQTGISYVDFRNTNAYKFGSTTSEHNNLTMRDASNAHPGTSISLDTSTFNNNLASTDNTVQKAMEKIDNITLGGGITYTGGTPANNVLLLGTGSSSTAKASGITLTSNGNIPNSRIEATVTNSSAAIQLDNQANWETYRFRRLNFGDGPNSGQLRGIQTLPNLQNNYSWLRNGDWVEVSNTGTQNYNCQIQTANVGQQFSGAWSGNSALINQSQTRVYRIQYTGSSTTWSVTQGIAGASGASEEVASYGDPCFWTLDEINEKIFTNNNVEINSDSEVISYPLFGSTSTNQQVSINTHTIIFSNKRPATKFFKNFFSLDTSFPSINIDYNAGTVNDTSAQNYLSSTVLNTNYNQRTFAPSLTYISKITYESGTTMKIAVPLNMDLTNINYGATYFLINGATNSLNNGEFLVTGIVYGSTYNELRITNSNASASLNEGDGTYTVASLRIGYYIRLTNIQNTSSSWGADITFYINQLRTLTAEIEETWFENVVESYMNDVYADTYTSGGMLTIDGTLTCPTIDVNNIKDTNNSNGTAFQRLIKNGNNNLVWANNSANSVTVKTTSATLTQDELNVTYYGSGAGVLTLPQPNNLDFDGSQLVYNIQNSSSYNVTVNIDGSIPFSTGATSITILPGYNNYFIVRRSSTSINQVIPLYVSPVYNMLGRRQSTSQNVSNATDTVVLFDTADNTYSVGNTGITYSNGVFTNNNSFGVIVTVSFQIQYASNSTGHRLGWIRQSNDNTKRLAYTTINALNTEITMVSNSATFYLTANDTFSLLTWQTSGTTLTIGAGAAGGLTAGYANKIQITVNK